jgi:4-methyl-5(b-hydroxyethyl)-thiazole monophosphate biosynthesis
MSEPTRKKALVILADGFEDIEAVTPIDVLTRTGVEVTIAALNAGPVNGAYGTTIVPRTKLDFVESDFDVIVLPGGRKNAEALADNLKVRELILRQDSGGKLIAAICASPSHVLAEAAGILKGRRATGDPAFNDKLAAAGAIVTEEAVTVDGNVITATGPGSAFLFALQITDELFGGLKASELAERWKIDWRAPQPVTSE